MLRYLIPTWSWRCLHIIVTNKVIITWCVDNISKDFFDLLNRIVCVLYQEVNIQSRAATEIGQAVNQVATLEDKAVFVLRGCQSA